MQAQIVADVATSTVDTVSRRQRERESGDREWIRALTPWRWDCRRNNRSERNIRTRPGRDGTLSYHIAIDSLSSFAGMISPDTAVVRPRPGILARASRAQGRFIEIARATRWSAIPAGTPQYGGGYAQAVRRNELSGSVRADGVAREISETSNVKGTASGSSIVAAETRSARSPPTTTGSTRALLNPR